MSFNAIKITRIWVKFFGRIIDINMINLFWLNLKCGHLGIEIKSNYINDFEGKNKKRI